MILEPFADGFGYPESPRWHAGELWLSDFDNRRVLSIDSGGRRRVRATVAGIPSGLAFPGAEPVVASMETQEVLRIEPDGTTSRYADLSAHAVGSLNDLVLAPGDRIFAGCFGYDLKAREKPRPGPLLTVSKDGLVAIAHPAVTFANGMVLTEGGSSLLVAESPRGLVTRFALAVDGTLGERTVFADLGKHRQPDGLCLDAAGGLWIGSPFSQELLRVDAKGNLTHVVATPGRWAIACALGGPDGSTLYLLTAETDLPRFAAGKSLGRIECGRAPYPAAPVPYEKSN